jgi:hypothetical protein
MGLMAHEAAGWQAPCPERLFLGILAELRHLHVMLFFIQNLHIPFSACILFHRATMVCPWLTTIAERLNKFTTS